MTKKHIIFGVVLGWVMNNHLNGMVTNPTIAEMKAILAAGDAMGTAEIFPDERLSRIRKLVEQQQKNIIGLLPTMFP